MLLDAKHDMCFGNRVVAAHQIGRDMDRHQQRLREIQRGAGRTSFSHRPASAPRLTPSRRMVQESVQREVQLLRENQAALARLRAVEHGVQRERQLTLEQRQAAGRAEHDTAAARERRQAQTALAESNAKQRQRVASATPRFASREEIAALHGTGRVSAVTRR